MTSVVLICYIWSLFGENNNIIYNIWLVSKILIETFEVVVSIIGLVIGILYVLNALFKKLLSTIIFHGDGVEF